MLLLIYFCYVLEIGLRFLKKYLVWFVVTLPGGHINHGIDHYG